MTLDLGTLVGHLELDDSKWDSRFDQAAATLKSFETKNVPKAKAAGESVGQAVGEGIGEGAADGVAGEAPKLKAAGEKAGESAGEGMLTKGRAAAAAAGTAIGLAFWEAMDVGAGNDRLAASLGATPALAERYGDLASELYAGAWGESIEDVNTAIGSTVSSIRGMREASDRQLERATIKALDFAATFEVDVPRAVQVAGTVINSGLAKNAVEAFDLLTTASQRVPAALREDVQDAIEEYGQFFSSLGYSGEQAFAMLVEGSEKGIYGIDKVGDAVKEFTIRSTDMSEASKDAYEAIGLDAQDMADKIVRGGDDAQEATQKVIDGLLAIKDPADRANTAIALFGTPLEDLNVTEVPEFLRQMQGASDAMDDFEGSSRRAGDTLNDNAKAKITGFTRTVKMELVNFLGNEVIPAIEDFADSPAAQEMWDAVTGAADDLRPLGKEILPAVATGLSAVGDALSVAAPLAKEVFTAFNSLPDWAQSALVLGGGAAVVAKKGKGGGGGGVAGLLGGGATKKNPVPVWVVNGAGAPGAGPTVVPDGDGNGRRRRSGTPSGPEQPSRGRGRGTNGLLAMVPFIPGLIDANQNDHSVDDAVDALGRADDALHKLGDTLKVVDQYDLGGLRNDFDELDTTLAGIAVDHPKKAMRMLKDAAADAGVSVDMLKDKLPKTAQNLEWAGDEAHRSSVKVDGLHDSVDGVPLSASTLFNTPGLDAAYKKAKNYKGILEGIDPEVVTTFIAVRQDKVDDQLTRGGSRSGPGVAGGGVFTSAQWAYLGESGAEIVRPLEDDLRMRRQAQGPGIDMDRLEQLVASMRPLYGHQTVMPHDYNQFRREQDSDRRRAALAGRRVS